METNIRNWSHQIKYTFVDVRSITFSPFMGTYEEKGVGPQLLRYPGQYYDQVIGFFYNMNRYYYPAIGRYVQPDPITANTPIIDPAGTLPDFLGEQDFFDESAISPNSLNPFSYARNNPLRYSDPSALFGYNKPEPETGRLPNDTAARVRCLENCIGIPLVVTGGSECGEPHVGGSFHCEGKAADFGFGSNPQLPDLRKKFICCAKKCKFALARREEKKSPHYHAETEPGGRGKNEIPTCPGDCQ